MKMTDLLDHYTLLQHDEDNGWLATRRKSAHERMLHCTLGLAAELAEVSAILSSHKAGELFGCRELEKKKRDMLIDETGDVFFYLNGEWHEEVRQHRFMFVDYRRAVGYTHYDAKNDFRRYLSNAFYCNGLLADIINKSLHHDRSIDKSKVSAAAITLTNCINHMASIIGVTMEEVIERNIAKLQKRHGGGGYTHESQKAQSDKNA